MIEGTADRVRAEVRQRALHLRYACALARLHGQIAPEQWLPEQLADVCALLEPVARVATFAEFADLVGAPPPPPAARATPATPKDIEALRRMGARVEDSPCPDGRPNASSSPNSPSGAGA